MRSVVATPVGDVRGGEEDGVWSFRGVPYARAGGGVDRWRRPEPPERWSGVRDALAWGPVAPQNPPVPGTSFEGDPTAAAEDCLNLNVWTPGLDDRRRPVMVWVHGGSFVGGTGASRLYDGATLARRGDVVVVTINYRLGALGFLAHRALADTDGTFANWGMLDQLAALGWVAEAIGAFGGDPDRVTVFAESAGAISLAGLLTTDAAGRLFHRAVLQSGPPAVATEGWSAGQAERLARILGVPLERADLGPVPADALVEGVNRLAAAGGPAVGLHLMPTLDGRLLGDDPTGALAAGAAARVPLLVGTNRDEARFFLLAERGGIDEAALAARCGQLAEPAAVPEVIGAYRAARVARREPADPFDVWAALVTDAVFRVPALRLLEAHAAHGPGYAYLFDWVSPFLGEALGSCHALEIPFVFGTVRDPGVGAFSGSGPDAVAVSDRMQDAWLAFARTGEPATEALGPWPPYDPADRPTMVVGPDPHLAHDPRGEERSVWDRVGAGSERVGEPR